MKKKGIVAVVVAAAVIGAAFTVSSCKLIKTGQTGIYGLDGTYGIITICL